MFAEFRAKVAVKGTVKLEKISQKIWELPGGGFPEWTSGRSPTDTSARFLRRILYTISEKGSIQ